MKPICLLEVFADVWAEKEPPSLTSNHAPIMVYLKPEALPVRDNTQCHGKHAWEFRPTYSS
jgi:hypothetical protein